MLKVLKAINMDNRENRPYGCEYCELRFTTKQFLQRHYSVHTEERNFQCIICKNCYKYKKGLNRHYKKAHTKHYQIEIGLKYQSYCLEKPIFPSSPSASSQSNSQILKPNWPELDVSKIFITSPFPTVN